MPRLSPMSRLLPILLLVQNLAAPGLSIAADSTAPRHAIFRSTDRGRTWTQSDTGLPGHARINALAGSSHRHFAGTDAGVFVSDDSGATWRSATVIPGLSRRVLDLCLVGSHLYAGTDGGGIVRSDVEGRSWKRVDPGEHARRVRSLALAQEGLYAGLDAGGVLSSSNRATTWVTLAEGLPPGAQVFALAELGGSVFAGLYAKGLYRFDASVGRWCPAGDVVPLALVAAGDNLIAGHNPGGIHWSSDMGRSWRPAAGDLPPSAPVWAMDGDRELVFAGVSDGFYRSEDQGRSWAKAESGLPRSCPGIAFLVRDALVLAAVIISDSLDTPR